MAETIQAVITKEWLNISDGQCEVQSVKDRDAFNKIYFDLVVSATKPADDTNVFMRITLAEHANFNRDAPVWLRLNAANIKKDQPVIVIK